MILFYNYIDAYSYKSCNTANPFHSVNTRVHKTFRKNYEMKHNLWGVVFKS